LTFDFAVLLLQVSTLVVVEHRNAKVAAPTLNTLTAAGQLGGDVTALVGGHNVQQVAEQTAALPGVNKVSTMRLQHARSPTTANAHWQVPPLPAPPPLALPPTSHTPTHKLPKHVQQLPIDTHTDHPACRCQ
jgi:hypothetical protein